MILDRQQLQEIFKTRPTRNVWQEANDQRQTLQAHLLGHGLEGRVKTVDTFESNKQKEVRKKYGKSNKDIFARVLRPIDNIWNARGGGVQYMLSESEDKKLRRTLGNIWNRYDLRRWIETFWLPRYLDDPMGIILMEVGDPASQAPVYPTYKASCTIHEALLAGRQLEYLILKTQDPKTFRVLDDQLDQLVQWDGETLTYLKSKKAPVYPNYFNYVPGILVSDIAKDGRPDFFASPVDKEVELADQIFREGSIAALYRFKFGFSRPWKYPEVCGTCKGAKTVAGQECIKCNGSGIKIESEPGDVSVFAWPDKDNPEIAEKGGFIQPDLDFLKYTDEWLYGLEEAMQKTHWGTYLMESPAKGTPETATGRSIDVKPIERRLCKYAKAAESIEIFCTNQISTYLFNQDQIASVSLGRRFMLQDADDIWRDYLDSRVKGAPETVLNDLLQDYYETKLEGNQQERDKYLKLIRLEPAVHSTLVEAKANLPYLDYMMKLCFRGYVDTKLPGQILATPLQALKDELKAYTLAHIAELIPDPLAPVLPLPGAGAAGAAGGAGDGGQSGESGAGGQPTPAPGTKEPAPAAA